MIVQHITLDVLTEIAPVLVYAKVGDTDRTLAISLVSHGKTVGVSKDYTAVLTAKRSWGETMVHGCVVEGGLVKYQFNEDTVREIDELKCEIKVFTPEGTLFTSARFGIRVKEPNWTTGDNIVAPSAPTRVLLTPETGAAEGQLLRVKKSVNGIVTQLEAADSEYWIPDNQLQLQEYLDAGRPTMVTKNITIKSSVVIRRRSAMLKFTGEGCLTPIVKGIAAIVLDAGAEGVLSYTRIENPRIVGNWVSGNDSTNGSVGILIKSKGRYNEIFTPKIENCECGIRTGGEYYDWSQTPNVIYAPYFENCRINSDICEGWNISSGLAVGITATDDGNGNIVLASSGVSATDDGDGNIVIGG